MTARAKILVIDDEPGIREGCRRALTPQGFAVDVAAEGNEGLAKVRADGYDLVLLDVMMPGISGLDLLALLHEADPDLVCIIITGYATVALAVSAIKQGAYDFLTKPFTADDLLLAVNQGVERRKLLLETRRLRAVEAEAQRLASEKARLEELDQAKAAFIRLVTHELQAPAAAVQSYLQLILEGYIPPEKQREIIEKAAARASEEVALIADLLELGRLREIKDRGQVGPVRLDDVLTRVLEAFQSQAGEKGLRLTVEIEPHLPPVRGIPNEFKSLWSNLISNAIKYTPRGGAVSVSLRSDGRQVVGQVRDSGIGIPAEARDRLFTEFYRAENAKALSLRGTGLGLVIVKQVVEAAGGQIWVESEVGRGSTFTFVLPAAAAEVQPPKPAAAPVVGAEYEAHPKLRLLPKSALPGLISALMEHYEVVGPVARDGHFDFAPISDPADLRLDYSTTILPPKKYLLPEREVLFTFRDSHVPGTLEVPGTSDGAATVTPVFDATPRIIFGIHTCDLHAIRLLDAVFATGERDEHYLRRRANTLLVSLECLTPCSAHAFCKSMNTLSSTEGFDLHLVDVGDAYAVEVGTTAGEALLARQSNARPLSPSDQVLLNKVLSDKWPRFPYRLDFDAAELPSLMALSYRSPLWAELGARCLACGACNLVCPTCYCFDVRDRLAWDGRSPKGGLGSGERIRVWDSCQLDEFARVASGENFRESRAARQRHRFYRKGKYMPELHGELGCVGCGRCASACLVKITPVETWNRLHAEHVKKG